jgi:hypothetical protein
VSVASFGTSPVIEDRISAHPFFCQKKIKKKDRVLVSGKRDACSYFLAYKKREGRHLNKGGTTKALFTLLVLVRDGRRFFMDF